MFIISPSFFSSVETITFDRIEAALLRSSARSSARQVGNYPPLYRETWQDAVQDQRKGAGEKMVAKQRGKAPWLVNKVEEDAVQQGKSKKA